mmetsp:Transcript_85308/g.275317  ORF Transcript_85308/g.275317 Transcript_85308/m.275317 type:complete len:83 (-) Transcript_85308:363-611(-)
MGLACTREQGLEGGARTAEELVPVTLHVYDIGSGGGGSALNRLLKPLGLGAFHCGVEVIPTCSPYPWAKAPFQKTTSTVLSR